MYEYPPNIKFEDQSDYDRKVLAKLNYQLLIDCSDQQTGNARLDGITRGGPVFGQMILFRRLEVAIISATPTKTDGIGKGVGPWRCYVTGGPHNEAWYADFNKLTAEQHEAVCAFCSAHPYVADHRVLTRELNPSFVLSGV